MALGEILKNARVQKGLSASDVAESTHLMVQVVEDLEREDFRRIAAPIYGRGFVKLYAELLELDPVPLIRDFMELYAGAHAPAVHAKRVESKADAVSENSPRVVAGVGGGMPCVQPPRQPVQVKPLVRPLSAQKSAEPLRVDEVEVSASASVAKAEPLAAPSPSLAAEASVAEDEPVVDLVVESEEPYAESDEPDLFRPKPLRRRPEAESVALDERGEDGRVRRGVKMPKLPIFKIGGRMEKEPAPEAHDEASHARRLVRIQKFVEGFNALKNGVESRLQATVWPRKQILVLSGVGLAVVVCMAIGIGMLFKMTGSNVKETPGVLIGAVAPPPDMYVD